MRPWIVWATGLLAYIIAVLDRTTLGVSGLQAADRFAASPGVLSTFVVLQVIVYAAAQVPAGLLLDRFGSRALIVCGAALMTSGQLVLALSESLPAAIGARAVVGLGDALTFISVLRLVPYWFEPERVPLVAQLTGICGQLGQVLSAVPFLAILTGSGWTPAYLSVAAFGVVVIALALALIRNTPHGSALTSEPISLHTTLSRIKTVWLRPGTRLGFFTHMGTQFSVTVFALMWGVPYLTVAQGLSETAAGSLLTISVVAAISAGIVIGIFTGRHPHRRSRLVLWIIASNALVWTVVLALPGPAPVWLLVVLIVAIPVGVYLVAMFVIYSFLVKELDLLHALLLVLAAAVLVIAVVLAAQGTSMALCLLVVTAAPVVVVIGFEAVGHRHAAEIVGRRLDVHRPG
ncbi:MFS transporter [Mycolicibacterium conceptionense]|uniref:MFS transporter n=1 Tax=Mycolicibacterium conceptionense TaxID=451644 RepID=UPI0009D6C349|nr:MFS transporter [Mycolicibacterium conceptionense]